MSLKSDLRSAIAQAELQMDSLIPNLSEEGMATLSQKINEHSSEIYDLLGPKCYQSLVTMGQIIRLALLKAKTEQMLREAEDNV